MAQAALPLAGWLPTVNPGTPPAHPASRGKHHRRRCFGVLAKRRRRRRWKKKPLHHQTKAPNSPQKPHFSGNPDRKKAGQILLTRLSS